MTEKAPNKTVERIAQSYAQGYDLENCAGEPLRRIQVVQSYACLLVVDPNTLIIRFASENTEEYTGWTWQEVLNRPITDFFDHSLWPQLNAGLRRPNGFETLNPIRVSSLFSSYAGQGAGCDIICSRSDDWLYVEIEETSVVRQTARFQRLLSRAIFRIQQISDFDGLFVETAAILKNLTGYDRVMVYRFDEKYNGEVIAEAREEHLEPFEGLRYPHTDIPEQARALYLENRVRLIDDVERPAAPIHASDSLDNDAAPLDLTHVGCRGVSPVHIEYLGYMGVRSSMSVAIVMDGKLWGLFAMHHYTHKRVDFAVRGVLRLIGQIFSGHLSLQLANRYREQTLQRNLIRVSIGEQVLRRGDLFDGLVEGEYNLFNLFDRTTGAIINFEGRFETYRKCPDKDDFLALMDWITSDAVRQSELVYRQDKLGEVFPSFKKYCDTAAGLLVVFLKADLSDYICWFRPGMKQQINWGGKPVHEIVESDDGSRRLSPRRSFARYIETVENCSAPWTDNEIDTAYALRVTLVDSLLLEYSEVKEINKQLKRAYEDLETFSYTVSHDLRAPLRAISGFSAILAEDYRGRLDEEAHELIDGIERGVGQMNDFITDILEFSKVGSQGLKPEVCDVRRLVTDVVENLLPVYVQDHRVDVSIEENPPAVNADARMLRQLFTNLLSNAFKYCQPNAAGKRRVAVGYHSTPPGGEPTTYYVSNTGPGIAAEHIDSVFQMFSRLSDHTGTEGTGIGLAIVKRIVKRHNGDVWVTNDKLGVTFNFYFNKKTE